MAAFSPKLVQRVGISHKASNINGISWSEDNKLAFATNSLVSIININGVCIDDKRKEPRLKFKRSSIPVDSNLPNNDVDYEFSMVKLTPMSGNPFYSTAVLDSALNPNILKTAGFDDVTCIKWSPVGCDRTGRSVLAVLFRTNKLSLYIADKQSLYGWFEVIDLNAKHLQEMKNNDFFVENESLKGELCPDERRSLGKKETWKEFNEWQRRKYLINFTNIEWFPATFSCLHKATNISYKFTFLATIVRGCQLFVWQAQLPLVKNHSHLYRAVAANTLLFNPCILAWYGTTNTNVSYLACGNSDGIVKVFLLNISSTKIGIPDINIVKAYSFCDVADGVSIDCMKWYRDDSKLYLACSQGPHISLYGSHIMKEGTLSKPVLQVITGIHLLNVSGLDITSTGMLYSVSSEGTVQQFKIGSRRPSREVKCEILSGHGYSGVSVSPNGVFMALFETKRKLFHYTKGAVSTEGQCVILSLVSNEENERELLTAANHVLDMVKIRNRFLHRQLSISHTDSSDLPTEFNGLTKPYLQFLWNMFTSDPKYKSDLALNSFQLDLCEEDNDEGPIMVKNIEEEIATIAMQNALSFILDYDKTNRRPNYGPIAGDVTVKTLCCWIAKRQPSTSVIDMLNDVWRRCNNPLGTRDDIDGSKGTTEHGSKICEEMLTCVVNENCMCSEEIPFTHVRYGRCRAGHVWPRCCITFKLLDGTNARVCENCNAHALNRHPINSPYEDWTKHLLDVTSSCTFCGAWFEEI
ncbi:general transcription factor 3C polypeptide 4-like isoform X2 [Xenia sp. Carnegie-2017]|uniref:general transcription factor 3C polypeptide 4-like isoform X2 n=1 Tax=Xenia sp. Carnegie-2017 TaxID=2897299 RepID=UPI001F049144|nr:general transcription factor 3C polypeptide 4-like isoform X2 [Xenia sp. Carnegie-2017]